MHANCPLACSKLCVTGKFPYKLLEDSVTGLPLRGGCAVDDPSIWSRLNRLGNHVPFRQDQCADVSLGLCISVLQPAHWSKVSGNVRFPDYVGVCLPPKICDSTICMACHAKRF